MVFGWVNKSNCEEQWVIALCAPVEEQCLHNWSHLSEYSIYWHKKKIFTVWLTILSSSPHFPSFISLYFTEHNISLKCLNNVSQKGSESLMKCTFHWAVFNCPLVLQFCLLYFYFITLFVILYNIHFQWLLNQWKIAPLLISLQTLFTWSVCRALMAAWIRPSIFLWGTGRQTMSSMTTPPSQNRNSS